jgi:hypothetical protein
MVWTYGLILGNVFGIEEIDQYLWLTYPQTWNVRDEGVGLGAGATFDWLFFDNSKVINFDD